MSAPLLITPVIVDLPSTATDDARALRDLLVVEAGTVTTITDRLDADAATETLRSLTKFIDAVDAEREVAKAPALKRGREIDALARELLERVRAEQGRISRLCGSFEAEERRKANDARIAAANEAARIAYEAARATAAAVKAAPTVEAGSRAADAIASEAQTQIVAVRQAAISAPKPAASTLRGTVQFEVTDLKALFAAEPNLVTLEPNGAAIRAIIKANPNIILPGLRHWVDEKLNLR
jgi:hypothetical protein